jgi:hypothetical protein
MDDDVEAAKETLIKELYNRIDAGLGKRDAYGLADAIEALIDAKIKAAITLGFASTEHVSDEPNATPYGNSPKEIFRRRSEAILAAHQEAAGPLSTHSSVCGADSFCESSLNPSLNQSESSTA